MELVTLTLFFCSSADLLLICVYVWLQSRTLTARGRVGLEVYRCLCTGGSEFNAVPAATGRPRQHRSRSTWGLVSRSIGSISRLISRHLA
jgi:hypothetical protein